MESRRPVLVHMSEKLIDVLDRRAKMHGLCRSDLIRATLELHRGDPPIVIQVVESPLLQWQTVIDTH